MMKMFALAMLLAVMQAAPPVPRKAPDNASSSSKNVKQDSGNQQTPSGPAVATPQIDKQPSEAPANTHAQETIVIREPAPMPKGGKDWWDKAYVVFTGLLVAVGAYGVYKAKQTLKVIERQAVSMRRQTTHLKNSVIQAREAAHATKKSADALINAERAWIMTELDWQDGRQRIHVTSERKAGDRVDTSRIYLALRGKNEGRTPAWMIAIKFWCTLYLEAPPAKPDIAADIAFSRLGPDPLGIGQPLIEHLDLRYDGQRTQVASAVIIYGVVEYRDVFGDHETWCGYTVRGDPEHVYLERLAGYPEYNKNS